MDKDLAKQKIQELVEKYEGVIKLGQVKRYSEEETKKDFILPLFEAFGWDVFNKNEVSAEEHIKSAGRVDYGFYLNGRPKFYVEAKAFKADLHNPEFAEQAIRYSWNKGVTWAVLTDFENIKVFNTEAISESLSSKLLFDIPYSEFLERFEEQLWLLSKESFEQNLIDKYATKIGKMKQRVPVGEKLYKDLNECREILTNKLSIANPDVKSDYLDEGVQKLLDRLIFIKVAEDRGIEDKTLIPLLRQQKEKETLYESMIEKFRELNDIYNSNLFTPHNFEKWNDDFGATKEVINKLQGVAGYYEYDFKFIPTDILGGVYESYLGHRLQKSKKGLTLDKDAKKRKEQGIYYTPSFIVDYIVKNALKPVLDRCQSINDLKKIKVLDPACGSGSFLIKALELINEKYKEFNNKGDEFTKRMILTENLYGVDLDGQAVEITRLNLTLSALETRMKIPLLKNIKNGNSLISGTDEELQKYFGKNFRDKKPFNWQEEFPEVFAQGGFDVIIGNPPYVKEFVNKSVFDGLHDSPYYQGKMDLWTMFGCVAIDLLKNGGKLGFIAPNNWITNAGASIFRDKILKDGELETFIDFGDYKVFEQAGIQTMIFIFEKKKPEEKYKIDYLKIADKNITENKLIADLASEKTKIEIEPDKIIGGNLTFAIKESNSIFEKIRSKKNFDLTDKEVAQGIVADPDKAFIFQENQEFSIEEKVKLKNYFTSVSRYYSGEQRGLIAYLDKSKNYDIEKMPKIKNQLLKYRAELDNRREVKSGRINWFNLHWPREEWFFTDGPKIVCGIRTKYPSFYYTDKPYYGSRALNFIKTDRIDLKYLTGILNSRVSYFWLKNMGKQLGDLLQIDKGPLLDIPIYIGSKEQQKPIIALVDKMLDLNKEIKKAEENSDKWHSIKSEIEKTDKKIDDEVYKLYGLTEEDIKIVGKQKEENY